MAVNKVISSKDTHKLVVLFAISFAIAALGFFLEYYFQKQQGRLSASFAAESAVYEVADALSNKAELPRLGAALGWLLFEKSIKAACIYNNNRWLEAVISADKQATDCPERLTEFYITKSENIWLDITHETSGEAMGGILVRTNTAHFYQYASLRALIFAAVAFITGVFVILLFKDKRLEKGNQSVKGVSLQAQFEGDGTLSSAEKVLTNELIDAFKRMGGYLEDRNGKIMLEVEQLRKLNATMNSVMVHASHELRNPLHSIINCSDMGLKEIAESNSEEAKQLTDYLRLIRNGASKIVHLVSLLFDISKIESGALDLRIDKENLLSIISKVKLEMSPLFNDKNVALEIEAPKSATIDVYCDIRHIEIVLDNLLSNALEYTPNGGKVSISYSPSVMTIVDASEERTINALELTIHDSGPGFPPNELEDIFLPFNQGSNTYLARKKQGCGLGLTLCKSIIDAHKGYIYAKNDSAGGAVVTFCLPCEEIDIEESEVKLALSQKKANLQNELREIGKFEGSST